MKVLRNITYHRSPLKTWQTSETVTLVSLTLAGTIFFAPLRGYRPQKWSPGESALVTDWLIRDLQIQV